MGRHRARREALRNRLPDAPAEAPASDPLRLTPWRVIAGVVAPGALLCLWASVSPLWRDASWFVVLCGTEIALFLLAFLPRIPPRWVDRWHGRWLVVGSVLGGCATVLFTPLGVFALVGAFAGAPPRDGGYWLAQAGVISAGPLLFGTTRAYWRTADGLARRAFGAGPRLSRRALEQTFE